jgi:hypothetical protein
MSHTITVKGRGIPFDHYAEVLDGTTVTPRLFTEITGPMEAFKVETRNGNDYVRVMARHLVTARYFERAS